MYKMKLVSSKEQILSFAQRRYDAFKCNKKVKSEKDCSFYGGIESGDMIVRDYDFYTPKVGETLCTYSTGAYCYSMSMNYNGLVRPGVVFINNDKIKVAIRRETLEELVSTCVFD